MRKDNVLGDNIGSIELVDSFKDNVALKVVKAARASYQKNKEGELTDKDQKLIKFLWKNEHTSPFRHSYFSFKIKLPIFVARQWMKYQVGSSFQTIEADGTEISIDLFEHLYDTDKGCSWNEVSGRYVEFSPTFYIPLIPRANPPHGNKQASEPLKLSQDEIESFRKEMKLSIDASYLTYVKMLEKGYAKEIARMVLPLSLYTEVYWTASLQAILHFLHQRTKPDAQYEIRMYANAIEEILENVFNELGIEYE